MSVSLVTVVVLVAAAHSHASSMDGDFWDMQPYYNRLPAPQTNSSGDSGDINNEARRQRRERGSRRTSRQADMLLAVPDGAVIGILPKFGWLLYEGESHEEIDFRVESEFLYRFPRSRASQVGLERSLHSGQRSAAVRSDHYHPNDLHQHQRYRRELRQSRMVRDKRLIYRGLARMFRNFGLDGDVCVQRTVCEISSTPLLHDGIIGELLNIALIPSHRYGEAEGLEEYREAEKFGREGGDCEIAYMHCPMSMFVHKTM